MNDAIDLIKARFDLYFVDKIPSANMAFHDENAVHHLPSHTFSLRFINQ